MNDFDAMLNQSQTHFDAAFGETISYCPADGEPVEVTVEVLPLEHQYNSFGDVGRSQSQTCRVVVARSRIAAPAIADKVELRNRQYAVTAIEQQTVTHSTLQCERVQNETIGNESSRTR